jgi:DNA-binding MarR family transcriptional regulator
MGAVRQLMARHEPCTVPQFRALLYVDRHAGANLSAVADFLGLTLPSASRLIDQMVKHDLLMRQLDPEDRRRMTLRMTPRGVVLLKNAQDAMRRQLASILDTLADAEIAVLERALGLLHVSFPPFGGDSLSKQASAVPTDGLRHRSSKPT